MSIQIIALISLFFSSFGAHVTSQTPTAKVLIQNCIAYHGGKNFNKYNFSFEFRNYQYTVASKKGVYRYTRSYSDDNGIKHRQVLSNEGYQQYENELETVPDLKTKAARKEAINSVVYFAMLPQALNDQAVIAEYSGSQRIVNKYYHIVKVSFAQQGGGVDHSDIFYYWMDQEDYSIDYLAYSYTTNGGGTRFRAAFNPRRIEGILIQDYINYTADKGADMLSLPELYEQGKLSELSRIELKMLKKL